MKVLSTSMMPQATGSTKVQGGPMQTSRRFENLKATSEKAREAREKTQEVFLGLIDTPVAPQDFIDQVRWINPEVYDDVTRERAISGLCAYPMCGQALVDAFGERLYIIRNNKVYNITERRNYCSDVCYEASGMVRRQVSTVPLYLRHTDGADLPRVKLPARQNLKGSYGKLVDITGGLIDLEEDTLKQKSVFKSVDDIAKENLITWSENENSEVDGETRKPKGRERRKSKEKLDVIEEDEGGGESEIKEENEIKKEIEPALTHRRKSRERKTSIDSLSLGVIKEDEGAGETETNEESEVVGEKEVVEDLRKPSTVDEGKQSTRGNIESTTRKTMAVGSEKVSSATTLGEIDEESVRERKIGDPDPLLLVYEVERTMREWMSFDSLRFILGDKYVRGMLEHIGATWEDYDTTAGLKLSMDAKVKYIALCRKLDHEERSEELEMKHTLEEENNEQVNDSHSQAKQPLPDYKRLQEDVMKQELKVVSFLGGQDQYEEMVNEEEGEIDPMETITEEIMNMDTSGTTTTASKLRVKKRSFPRKAKKVAVEESEDENFTMPFVDSYCQTAWRQHIVVEKLTAYMADGVSVMKLDNGEVRRILRGLVATLYLTPNNITFKPRQWRLVTCILLHMLTVRYSAIHLALMSEEGCLIQTEVASSLGLDVGYWDRVMSYLTEITHIISKSYGPENETASGKNKINKEGNEESSEKGIIPDQAKESSSSKNEMDKEEKHSELDNCEQEKHISTNKPEVREDVNKQVGDGGGSEDASILSMVDGQSIKNLTIN
ncbi:hypothetical protein Pmani_009723 [Petrolisthes manimaculis]|uniref:RNA polymerase II subunit B1 CTD phosphatase RPAP2 homolog n=1 Tax=Petrolisthes manimaculis TaxID=1843537 RepID=A0AAE1Q472_9EUCA|nr:hypothetical protein Pmani_009723 [Petrolisthes manimaculis]